MLIIDRHDTIWWHKLNGALRRAIVLGALNSVADPVVLTEYPKSGGSWLSQMLSAVLEVPYTRNRLPASGDQIIHGCYLKVHRNIDTIVVWRDGRDTMVSYYFHMMFDKPITSAMAGKSLRSKLGVKDPHNIEANLPRFIEWAFTGGYPRFTWADFVNRWYGSDGVVFTSYEACLEAPGAELSRVLGAIGRYVPSPDKIQRIVANHSFETQSNRKPGEEDIHSFIRKGVAGDWRNYFDKESKELFFGYAGQELKLLGYEKDDSWVV